MTPEGFSFVICMVFIVVLIGTTTGWASIVILALPAAAVSVALIIIWMVAHGARIDKEVGR